MRCPAILTILALAPLSLVNCPCEPPPPVGGQVCGTGTVDGAPYAIDPARTRLVLVVLRQDGGGCGVFHNHVVTAQNAVLEYAINSGDAGASTFSITVSANGLVADDPDLRDEFLTQAGEDGVPLSEGDRSSIGGSVRDEVLAADHPTLVFTIKNMSATSGAGTATLTADLAGATSDVEATYTVTKEGDDFIIQDGTATLDGAPYGIPRNSLGFCVSPSMALHFDLALIKAPAAPVCNLDGGVDYEPQFFDDQAEAENVGYNDVRGVAVRRCAGCHGDELKLGGTVPLVRWEDWRGDSPRNPGRPLYETAQEYIHLDPADGLSMPPQDLLTGALATDLRVDEEALFDAWVADGARNVRTGAPEPEVFPRVTVPADCAPVIKFEDVSANPSAAGSAFDFFSNQCAYCHADVVAYAGVPQVGTLDVDGIFAADFAAAAAPIAHSYYAGDDGANLSFWEASVVRYVDGSMVPGGNFFGAGGFNVPTPCTDDVDCADEGYSCFVDEGICADPSFIAFAEWVNAGYCE